MVRITRCAQLVIKAFCKVETLHCQRILKPEVFLPAAICRYVSSLQNAYCYLNRRLVVGFSQYCISVGQGTWFATEYQPLSDNTPLATLCSLFLLNLYLHDQGLSRMRKRGRGYFNMPSSGMTTAFWLSYQQSVLVHQTHFPICYGLSMRARVSRSIRFIDFVHPMPQHEILLHHVEGLFDNFQ